MILDSHTQGVGGLSREKGTHSQTSLYILLYEEYLFMFHASISVLPNTGSLYIPGHKLKIQIRDTFCARLIMIRADRFLEITSRRNSEVLQP